MNLQRKKRVMVKAKLDEISIVDKPAQDGARIVLRKRADEDSEQPARRFQNVPVEHVLFAAESFAKSGGSLAAFEHLDEQHFHDAMESYASTRVLAGETPEQAFTRLCFSDDVMKRLDLAARAARTRDSERVAQEVVKARAAGQAPPAVHGDTLIGASLEEVEERLQKAARALQQPGETDEQAFVRALEQNPQLYAAHLRAVRGQ